ncbi:tetratricopeptide repeat protein [Candidatus Poribacteria bacterium]|nr:tetratricopeptide repeat protein [Candidatus Poribacteria bacterium]
MYNGTANLDTAMEHFQNGRNFQRQGLLEEAAQQFLRVIKLDEHSASAYFNMGAICFQRHQYEEAIGYYKAGLKLAPQNVSAHADLGKTYEMLAEWDEALYHLNKALDLHPTHEAAQRRKRRILEEKPKYEILREQVKSAIVSSKRQTFRKSLVEEFSLSEAIPTSDNINAAVIERFVVKFSEGVSEEVRKPICCLLERIYIELGSEFDYYPQQNIKVFVLHTLPKESPQFLLPQWAVGQYDGSITIVWRAQEKPDLTFLYVVLQHEYVHLLVNLLTNGKCPMWLNEGLARYHSRGLLDSDKKILLQAVKQNRYIPLKHLEYNFSYLNKERVRLAYIESCSIVEFMMKTYGMKKIKQLLHSLGMDKSFNESLMCSQGQTLRFLRKLRTRGQACGMNSPKELETQWLMWVMDCYK